MFSITGANYVIDTNQAARDRREQRPHRSPTDVTVVAGHRCRTRRSPLGGHVYRYIEDPSDNLLSITGTKLYTDRPARETFKLDSSLVFTLSRRRPPPGTTPAPPCPSASSPPGTDPTINLYAGTRSPADRRFFTYKDVLYTIVSSEGVYAAVQKTVHHLRIAADRDPAATRRVRLRGVDLPRHRRHHCWRDNARRHQPGHMWAATSIVQRRDRIRPRLRLRHATHQRRRCRRARASPVHGHRAQRRQHAPRHPLRPLVANANVVQVDVPPLPSFTQTAAFTFIAVRTRSPSRPAATTRSSLSVLEDRAPAKASPHPDTLQSCPLTATRRPRWHAGRLHRRVLALHPVITPAAYHPFTYTASSSQAASSSSSTSTSRTDSDIYLGSTRPS